MDRDIFVLPGGANRGIIQTAALEKLEVEINRPLHEAVDLFIGTSVGAIVSSCLAFGVEASKMHNMLYRNCPRYFPKNSIVWRLLTGHQSLFDHKPILDDVYTLVGDLMMKDAKTGLITTAANMNRSCLKFFKWDDPKDADRKIIDVLSYAFAAIYYFGLINSDADQITYGDAGEGADNNPINHAWMEVLSRGWHLDGKINIYVFGTGYLADDATIPYSVTKTWKFIRQIANSVMLASTECETVNLKQVEFLNNIFHSVDLHVIDTVIPFDAKTFGNTKYDDLYQSLGYDMMQKAIDSGNLTDFISRHKV